MALVQQSITFGAGAATQIAPAGTYVTEVRVQPLRANTENIFVGDSSLTQDGSAGVIEDLGALGTGATVQLDKFSLKAKGGSHNYDAGTLYVWGTTGEGCNVTYWTM
jgi:hypothetical protein